MSDKIFLIVGLGNPGSQYEGTRHNVGYMVVDEIVRLFDCGPNVNKWDAQFFRERIWGKSIYFIKPTTYMNLSGKAVAKFVDFYKLSTENIIVVHDDLDMKTGRLKLVKGGGAGGHNGIRSLIQSLGTKDFYRLKIGIGRPGQDNVHKDFPVEKYVLSLFAEQELEFVQKRFEPLFEGLRYFVEGDVGKAMGHLNRFK